MTRKSDQTFTVPGIIAIILSGGLGTRLRPAFPDLPKCLVPVAGHPVLAWQLAWLRHHGVDHVHLAAGHLADQLAAEAERLAPAGLAISLSIEPSPLGTGGGLRFCLPSLKADTVCVLNGDSLVPRLDLSAMIASHLQSGRQGTVAVTPVAEVEAKGSIWTNEDGLITAFHEKVSESPPSINAGVYTLQRSAIANIPERRPVSLEKDIFPGMAADRALGAFECAPPLLDMGTVDGLHAMGNYLENTELAFRSALASR